MLNHRHLLVLLLLAGCSSPSQKYDAIAPVGKAPQYNNTSPNYVKGEPGKMGSPSTDNTACNEYRGMMVAPIEPVALKRLKEKCDWK